MENQAPHSITQQNLRWKKITDRWMEVQRIEEREIITIGDINLDSLTWDKNYNDKTIYQKSRHKMYKMIKTSVLDNGNFVINHERTRESETGMDKPTCLDMAITTHPTKISSHQTHYPTFSDHALIVINRNSSRMEGEQIYRKARSFKNFNREKFSQDIMDHELYIQNLYEGDTNQIAQNLTTIIQDSLDSQAPIQVIQISKKSQEKLSVEAREMLATRDNAHATYKTTGNIDDLRNFRNLRNTTNRFISKERYQRKYRQFNQENMTAKERWTNAKNETGQSKHVTPKVMIDKDKCHTKLPDIANSMNRQFLQKIRTTQESIPPSVIDPLVSYRMAMKPDIPVFSLCQITMSELRKIMTTMKPSSSTAADQISMKTIKQARTQLEPQVLHLINQIIKTSVYPDILKLTKILPIPKPPKDISRIDGWRPINLVPAISKLAEKAIMRQILRHITDNNLVNTNHHGSIQNHSTQTLCTELHDKLVHDYENDDEVALLLLDQSKAYDLVSHNLLLGKMSILNFNQKTLKTISSYLQDRRQFVQIQHIESDILSVGSKSVTQGSTLSCLFYLIFIMDIPQIGHELIHSPLGYRNCTQPNISTYVDDNYVKIKKQDRSLEEEVQIAMSKIKNYMDSNLLALNGDKTKILLVTKNQATKDDFKIEIQGKTIKHSRSVKILGNTLDENLTWDEHITKELIPSLKNRLRTLRLTTKYMGPSFKKIYTNSIFRGKLMYGIENWGGTNQSNITIIQKLQDQAANIALKGTKNVEKLSMSQKHVKLKWLSIPMEVELATANMVHKVINKGVPAELKELMPMNTVTSRIQIHRKLAAKPRILNKNQLLKSTFRSRAYKFNTLPGRITSLTDHSKFKKWAKIHFIAPSKVPKELNKMQMENELTRLNLQQEENQS